MSIVNVFESSRRVVMLTDTSLYLPDGTIVAFDQKAFSVESWNGAISGRGDAAGIDIAKELAEGYASFDEFIARSALQIERWHREAVATAGEGQTLIEIHAIGWSERADRPRRRRGSCPGIAPRDANRGGGRPETGPHAGNLDHSKSRGEWSRLAVNFKRDFIVQNDRIIDR